MLDQKSQIGIYFHLSIKNAAKFNGIFRWATGPLCTKEDCVLKQLDQKRCILKDIHAMILCIRLIPTSMWLKADKRCHGQFRPIGEIITGLDVTGQSLGAGRSIMLVADLRWPVISLVCQTLAYLFFARFRHPIRV